MKQQLLPMVTSLSSKATSLGMSTSALVTLLTSPSPERDTVLLGLEPQGTLTEYSKAVFLTL